MKSKARTCARLGRRGWQLLVQVADKVAGGAQRYLIGNNQVEVAFNFQDNTTLSSASNPNSPTRLVVG